ncbi:MAG: helix-turn-helix transcriptional regulator [Clostridia bacterium]|nr:helix-turn-helix transcriptional regulator [Clostridia bacterium]
MEEQLIEMGIRLAELREIKGLSQGELARKLDMTTEEYVAHEEGKRDFSFSFMFNVATILDVDVFNLLSGHSPKLSDCAVVKRGHEFFIKKEGSYDYKHLAFTFKNKKAEPFFVTSMPGEEDDKLHSHEGQEFNFVLSGVMLFKIGNMSYELTKGDSVYFNSKIPHGIKVVGDKPVKFLAVVMK